MQTSSQFLTCAMLLLCVCCPPQSMKRLTTLQLSFRPCSGLQPSMLYSLAGLPTLTSLSIKSTSSSATASTLLFAVGRLTQLTELQLGLRCFSQEPQEVSRHPAVFAVLFHIYLPAALSKAPANRPLTIQPHVHPHTHTHAFPLHPAPSYRLPLTHSRRPPSPSLPSSPHSSP
jgi:hypothetical protein